MRHSVTVLAAIALVSSAAQASAPRDGSHDFDFAAGAFHTHIRMQPNPSDVSSPWYVYDGTKTDTEIWGGKASLEEIEADGARGHLEFMSLRLYNPVSHEWSLNFADSGGGSTGVPGIGHFENGRGVFLDQEDYKGQTVLVRGTWSDITANSYHFEQALSFDEGKSWHVNFIARLTRIRR